MEPLYGRFLPLLPLHGRILDAGCGSGRDSFAFIQRGYSVVSFDASKEMVRVTTEVTGQPALLLRFDEMGFDQEFDGIWSCASLLHVPKALMGNLLSKFVRALKSDGVWYVSFKAGSGERQIDGRLFNYYTQSELWVELGQLEGIEIIDIWTTDDIRQSPERPKWTNGVLRRRA